MVFHYTQQESVWLYTRTKSQLFDKISFSFWASLSPFQRQFRSEFHRSINTLFSLKLFLMANQVQEYLAIE